MTFQLSLISDGNRTFLFFNYDGNEKGWEENPNRDVYIGYHGGNTSFNLYPSGKPAAFDIPSTKGNLGKTILK